VESRFVRKNSTQPAWICLDWVSVGRATQLQDQHGYNRKYALVAWLSLIGALLPARELGINAGVNLTPRPDLSDRVVPPALLNLLSRSPRVTWSDFFALATVARILLAACYTKGAEALLSAAGGESLEFLGAYMVGRAFGVPRLSRISFTF
jgi:hypothetical protein